VVGGGQVAADYRVSNVSLWDYPTDPTIQQQGLDCTTSHESILPN